MTEMSRDRTETRRKRNNEIALPCCIQSSNVMTGPDAFPYSDPFPYQDIGLAIS